MEFNSADEVFKAVGTSNRSMAAGQDRGHIQTQAIQQATDMMIPKVAQHVSVLQQQRWEQMQMEQQMLQQGAAGATNQVTGSMGPQQGPTGPQQGPQGFTGPNMSASSHGSPLQSVQSGPTTY